MKALSFRVMCLLLALLSAACEANDGTALSRGIADPARIAKETSLDNAYLSFSAKDAIYYAGFVIEEKGINQPTLVVVDKANGKQHTWKFDDIIADMFTFNSRVSIALESGTVYSLNDGKWERSPLELAEGSRIVFSDGKQHLIACTPSSLFMEDTGLGGCESHNPNWKISFSWHDIRPKVCDDLLYAVTWEQKQNRHLAINLESGAIVHQGEYAGEDICVSFDK